MNLETLELIRKAFPGIRCADIARDVVNKRRNAPDALGVEVRFLLVGGLARPPLELVINTKCDLVGCGGYKIRRVRNSRDGTVIKWLHDKLLTGAALKAPARASSKKKENSGQCQALTAYRQGELARERAAAAAECLTEAMIVPSHATNIGLVGPIDKARTAGRTIHVRRSISVC